MKKIKKFLMTGCLLCLTIAVCGMAAACGGENNGSDSEQGFTSVPEGVADFDETWLDD